jgi:hypothetical protein
MGTVFRACARRIKLQMDAHKVMRVGTTRVKPSEYFMEIDQMTSNTPEIINNNQSIVHPV